MTIAHNPLNEYNGFQNMASTPGIKPSPNPSPKRPPAPGRLALVQLFINSCDMEAGGKDLLSDPVVLERWLREHALLKERVRLTEGDLRHAIEVREALRDLLAANEGQPVHKDAVETLSRAARSAQLVVQFEEDGQGKLEPAAYGVDAALGELLAIAFRAMVDGSWPRLKACRDETCRWAFYDYSKNRSGSWCLMSVCGNRCKARKFRKERHEKK